MQLLVVTKHFFSALLSEQGCTVYSVQCTVHGYLGIRQSVIGIRNQHEKKCFDSRRKQASCLIRGHVHGKA
jgi:hypothetical protein